MALNLARDLKYESTKLALKRISLNVQSNWKRIKWTLNKKSCYWQDETTINLKKKKKCDSKMHLNVT